MPEITLAPGSEESALAFMLSDLLRQNLKSRPEKVEDFNALNIGVGIVAKGPDVGITMQFEKGKLTCHDGLVGNPGIVINTDLLVFTDLINIKIKSGMPYFFDEIGKSIIVKLLKRELKLKGLLTHPFTLVRLIRVMSIA